MKYLILLTGILFSLTSTAQDCNQELLRQKPGVWEETSGSISGITSADLASEKKVESSINSMIKSKYSPMGLKIKFGGAYESSYPFMPVNSYYYHIMAFQFYCEENKIKTVTESATTFQVYVNKFDVDVYDTAQGNRAVAEGFNVIHELPVEKDSVDPQSHAYHCGSQVVADARFTALPFALPLAFLLFKQPLCSPV